MPDSPAMPSVRNFFKSVSDLSRSLFQDAAAKTLLARPTRHPTPTALSSNPRVFDHTSLPPELWLIILREATSMTPDPLGITDSLSFLDAHPLHYPDYADAMRDKLALARVSRRFHDLVRPFLYEFVWISRAAQAKSLAHLLLLEFVGHRDSSGRFLRRLLIQTPVLERCAPADLRTILEYSPQLTVYADHQSVQRNCTRGDVIADPRCQPEELLSLLAHPRSELRRLSWTSYDDDAPFHLRMGPLRDMRAVTLEYLELSSSSASCSSPRNNTSFSPPEHLLAVHLPALTSLKVSLDDDMFAVLADWDMPALRNLSVLSADFSYAGAGFAAFFGAHGTKLRQLELGHSSALVEAHYLTRPPPPDGLPPLARFCPHLHELVCSADAGWSWQTPDWIAPHVLLPAHPSLEMIAVRDMDIRVSDALSHIGLPHEQQQQPGGFFPLLEQMSSLLRPEAFPQLKYVRDLSVQSARMREVRPDMDVLRFWSRVVERCKERGVWLEDYRGVNVSSRSLLRASLRRESAVWEV